MPEIGTSGSMSEDGKRSVAKWPKLPRLSSTLPFSAVPTAPSNVRFLEYSGREMLAGRLSHFDPTETFVAKFCCDAQPAPASSVIALAAQGLGRTRKA
jgi:hypothetical protein